MFDPHRTRRSDKRYYTRKGQVIQASPVNTKPIIDQRLVPVYKNYLITNNLIQPPLLPTIDSVQFSDDSNIYPISAFNLTTTNVTISGKCQTVILSTFANSRTFWKVDLLFLPSDSYSYTIPAGCRYLSFAGVGQVSDAFAFFSKGSKLFQLAQNLPNDYLSRIWIQTNFFSKSLIAFSKVPS